MGKGGCHSLIKCFFTIIYTFTFSKYFDVQNFQNQIHKKKKFRKHPLLVFTLHKFTPISFKNIVMFFVFSSYF